MIRRINFFGNPNVGVYALTTEKFAMVPRKLQKRVRKNIERILDVPAINTDIGQSRLIGVLAVANSNGICVPSYTMESEIAFLKRELDVPVEKIPTSLTALGNNILCNEKRALVNPEFEKSAREIISDVLGVEVVSGQINERNTVGSTSVSTIKGVLLPPIRNEEELRWIQEIFGVPASVGTINGGFEFVGSGLLANSKGAIAGLLTTGPELARIGIAFEL
ncbi:MAG: translation initiation factor IF-6 [Candidatus Helarchaeota archaeon]|nr:translation initiation factor IF-6 [Candidatus Helarchaeota archaeon]